MIVDTNVISEIMKPEPDPAVARWYGDERASVRFLTTTIEAELRFGLAFMPDSKRKAALLAALNAILEIEFANRIFAFERADALHYADIMAVRRKGGRPMAGADAQIAAIARRRGMPVVTRNVSDFEDCGLEIINPWAEAS